MTQDEINEHARRLLEYHKDEYEFYQVYEDEELEDLPYEDQRAIFDAIYAAKITITFD